MAGDRIFTNRDAHELYCAGHLMEAAIAYDRATGKHRFLALMLRYADYIYRVFYEEKSAAFCTPGHEEIELALLKLSEYTGEEKYRRLAACFLEERGKHPSEVYTNPEAVEEADANFFDGSPSRWSLCGR